MTGQTEKILHNDEKVLRKRLPFLVKTAAFFWIVYGLINFVYYSAVFIYSFVNPDFLNHLEYADFKSNWLLMPILFKLVINAILGISGFMILQKKGPGLIIFYFAISISIFFSLFFLSYFNYVDFFAGVVSIIIFVSYRRRIRY